VDEIALTLPADEAFSGVAHLVLGGLAVRLDLTVETLEDLELALDTLLERSKDAAEDELTIRVRVKDDEVQTVVGPYQDEIRKELERDGGDALDLRRILRTVCERVEVTELDGGQWVELTKRVVRVARDGA
jgi:anti-sigma regulatory factor (Ser/Thr protein kinase)